MKRDMSEKTKKYLKFISMLLFIIGITIVFLYVSPKEIVDNLGVGNSYLILFLLASIAGLSFFTHVFVFVATITLALAGFNPLLLGLVTAPGLLIGNSILYSFGGTIHGIFGKKLKKRISIFLTKLKHKRRYKKLPFFIYLFVSFMPVSPEVILLPLATIKYPFRKVIIPLFLGEVTFVTIISFLAQQGVRILT